jgi:hypothetical protein
MTEHDDVIDTLRRHRPEDLPYEVVSPHAPAAQALLEEILSMQTIDPVATAAAVPDASDVPDAPRRRRSRRAVTIAGAAAAAAAAVVAVSVVVRPADPSAASTVDAAIAQSLESLDVSGRAEVTMHEVYLGEQGEQKWVQDSVDIWEYSGDDSSVTGTFRINGIDAIPGDVDPINRRIDGEFYCYCLTSDGAFRWFHDPGLRGNDDALRANPATLLDQLRPAGDFQSVGTGLVDGAETVRFRATRPASTPAHVLRESWGQMGEVTDLEVWVDEDGLVRRVDLTFADDELPRPPDTATVSSATISVRFFDMGEPISIEAPTDPIELSGDGG